MPNVNMGGEKKEGISGTLKIKMVVVDDDLLKPTEWRADKAIAVTFTAEGKEVKLAVPLDADLALKALRPIFPDMTKTGDEARLRSLLAQFPAEPRWAMVYNGWVQRWACPPGTHRGTLAGTSTKKGIPAFYVSKDMKGAEQKRVRFILETAAGLCSEFSLPWGIETTLGQTPAQDGVQFSGFIMEYLALFGLNLTRLEADLKAAECLYHRLDQGITGPLGHHDNILPRLLERIGEDGLGTVEWIVEANEKYGPGIKREGQYKKPNIVKVVVEGSKPDTFATERTRFLGIMDKFASALFAREAKYTTLGGNLTEDGRAIAKGVLKPIITKYPHCIKGDKQIYPIEPNEWEVDGMVALGITMEMLMGEDLQDPAKLNLQDPAWLLEWVEKNAHGTLSFTVGEEAI